MNYFVLENACQEQIKQAAYDSSASQSWKSLGGRAAILGGISAAGLGYLWHKGLRPSDFPDYYGRMKKKQDRPLPRLIGGDKHVGPTIDAINRSKDKRQ